MYILLWFKNWPGVGGEGKHSKTIPTMSYSISLFVFFCSFLQHLKLTFVWYVWQEHNIFTMNSITHTHTHMVRFLLSIRNPVWNVSKRLEHLIWRHEISKKVGSVGQEDDRPEVWIGERDGFKNFIQYDLPNFLMTLQSRWF